MASITTGAQPTMGLLKSFQEASMKRDTWKGMWISLVHKREASYPLVTAAAGPNFPWWSPDAGF